MTAAPDYRAAAKASRAAALQEPLPNRREMHERSATLWDEMAESAEQYVQRSAERETARIERKEAAQSLPRPNASPCPAEPM